MFLLKLIKGPLIAAETYLPAFHSVGRNFSKSLKYHSLKNTHLTSITSKITTRKKKAGQLKLKLQNTEFLATVFSTAEAYDLNSLAEDIKLKGLYEVSPTIDPLITKALYVSANYKVEDEPRGIFFFEDGSVVFWNAKELEIQNTLTFLKLHEHYPYDNKTVFEESETIVYQRDNSLSQCQLANGKIFLKSDPTSNDGGYILEKYAFSHALSISAKLGIWEASLDEYIQGLEFIYDELRGGAVKRLKQKDVLVKSGEIYALRHLVNLSSDLLDTPDFYWEHEELEKNYQQTCSYLSTNKRTRVMNEKLNHLCELMDLVSTHLNDKHHVRLEVMIIALILVEVVFEIIHFVS